MAEIEKGLSLRKVGALFNINSSVISKIWQRYKLDGTFENFPARGGSRITSLEEDKMIYNEIKNNPNITVPELGEKFFISRKTMSRRAKQFREQIREENEKSQENVATNE